MNNTDQKVFWCQERDCHWTSGWRLAERAQQLLQEHQALTGHARVAERRDRAKYDEARP